MQTISAEQFKKRYGESSTSLFQPAQEIGAPAQESSSYLDRVKNNIGADVALRTERVGEIQARPSSGPIDPLKGFQMFGQGAGLAAGALETTVGEIPGIKQAVGAVGTGIDWLATSKYSPLKYIGEAIGGTKPIQKAVQLYDNDPNFKDTVDAVANIARLGLDVQAAVDSAAFAKNVTQKLTGATTNAAGAIGSKVGEVADVAAERAATITKNAPANIMQRVARISKGEQAKFEATAKESVGEYLTKRGIYGNIDNITTRLYDRFTKSRQTADDAFEKLPGTYEPAPVKTALQELVARETRVSSPGATSPNLGRARELLKKIDREGLTMPEINEVKRLYERNVKVDYIKSASSNPEGVVRATNIDTAMRSWQFQQAETLGLRNLPEINRETRLAKQLLDALGKEYSGAAGNNAITLTDWIMLSGGDPTAGALFLAKKGLTTKTVQAAIAKWMSKGQPVMGDLKSDIGPSKVKQLPPGTTKIPTITTPIEGKSPTSLKDFQQKVNIGATGMEPQAENVARTSTRINPKTGDVYVRDLKTGKVKIIPRKEWEKMQRK